MNHSHQCCGPFTGKPYNDLFSCCNGEYRCECHQPTQEKCDCPIDGLWCNRHSIGLQSIKQPPQEEARVELETCTYLDCLFHRVDGVELVKHSHVRCGIGILDDQFPGPIQNCDKLHPCSIHDKPPAHQEGLEALSEEIHHLYCAQYLKDHGKPYWTEGNYSKLDERTKECDRNIARFIARKIAEARDEKSTPYGRREAYNNGMEQGAKAERERILAVLDEHNNNNHSTCCSTVLREAISKEI